MQVIPLEPVTSADNNKGSTYRCFVPLIFFSLSESLKTAPELRTYDFSV